MIPIKNIYYMLSYAFRALSNKGYKSLETEEFDNVFELYTAIIIKGVSLQLKRGLEKEYIAEKDTTSAIKGKIDISESIKTYSMINNKMVCSYDDYSENAYMNRILKTTMLLLLKSDINKERKKALKKLLMYFTDIETLDMYSINWKLNYNRNNHYYRLLLSICHSAINGLLQTQSQGNKKMMDFLDDQRMSSLYERFILEYFKREYPDVKTTSSQINWQLDNDYNEMLPRMQTDVMLSKGNKILIIDTKYYSKTTQSYFNKNTIHSSNLYQIFTYVKNKEEELKEQEYRVSGMLLYAKTDEEIVQDNNYIMSGNRIDVRTLDLNCEFSEIENQLKEIVEIIY